MAVRLIIAWLCNLIDTIATVHLYTTYDGNELNPISAMLLKISPLLFVAFKLIVMTIAVMLCCWKRDWSLCKVASWILFIEYMFVAIYYIFAYLLLASI